MIAGTLQADNAIDGGQLCARILAAAGVDVSRAYAFLAPHTVQVVGFDDHAAAILAAIAAHVPDTTAQQAQQTAQAEQSAAQSDLAGQYATGQSQFDTILAATGMTNAQLFAAVQTEARILKRTLRLLKDALT